MSAELGRAAPMCYRGLARQQLYVDNIAIATRTASSVMAAQHRRRSRERVGQYTSCGIRTSRSAAQPAQCETARRRAGVRTRLSGGGPDRVVAIFRSEDQRERRPTFERLLGTRFGGQYSVSARSAVRLGSGPSAAYGDKIPPS